MDCVIIDLDGTLSDCTHRLHFIEGPNKNWDTFFEGCVDDPVIEPMLNLIKMFKDDYKIVIITARPERNREFTTQWLVANKIYFDALYMRKNVDFRKSPLVKSDLVDKAIADSYNPIYAFEDREDCCTMFRERGIFTMQVADSILKV
jgi:uncharacterized HAD superfamily protein